MDLRLWWVVTSLIVSAKTDLINDLYSTSVNPHRVYRNAFQQSFDNSGFLPQVSQLSNSSFDRYSTDNRKPAFRGCKDYAPSVKEEQPSNTFVIKVEAEDPDPHDSITYSFEKSVTERAKFRINSKTGEMVTSYTFDRDEPIREKEVRIYIH